MYCSFESIQANGSGNTESFSFGLKEKCNFSDLNVRVAADKTEAISNEENREGKLHESIQRNGQGQTWSVRGVEAGSELCSSISMPIRVKPDRCWKKSESKTLKGALKKYGAGNTEL